MLPHDHFQKPPAERCGYLHGGLVVYSNAQDTHYTKGAIQFREVTACCSAHKCVQSCAQQVVERWRPLARTQLDVHLEQCERSACASPENGDSHALPL